MTALRLYRFKATLNVVSESLINEDYHTILIKKKKINALKI